MDLDTSALVAKVNPQSIIGIKLGSPQNKNYSKSKDFQFEPNTEREFDDEDGFLDQDFLVDAKVSSSIGSISDSNVDYSTVNDPEYRRITFNESSLSNDHTDYHFSNYNIELNQYCETEVTDLIDDTILNDKSYPHVLLNSNSDNRNEQVLKYQNLVSSATTIDDKLITPESVLEGNSELDTQDQTDYTVLNELLSISEDIEPHFIASSFTNSENKFESKENQLDSSDMGIENTWNEDYAVPSTSNFPLPLPAPPDSANFSDFSTCNNFDAVEHGSYSSDLEALFSTNETETDITDVNAEEGVCGLRNLGNTCFMSTGIQCLAATKSLVQFFVRKFSFSDLDENSLTIQFTELLQKMWSGQYSVVHPMKFKQALGIYYPQFKDCSQHDCQEFLALLLDALHQQLICMPKEMLEENSFSLKDKIKERDAFMDVKMECLSSLNFPPTCNTFDECANNNNETSGNAVEKNDTELNSPLSISEDTSSKSQMEVVDSVLSKSKDISESENLGNFVGKKLNHIQDILKDTKTSNVNVHGKEPEVNNEICFDTNKFPRKLCRRNIAETDNHITNIAQKDCDSSFDSKSNFDDSSDLKRIKVNHLTKEKNCLMETQNYKEAQMEKNVRFENERKMKVLNVEIKHTNTGERMDTDSECDITEGVEEKMRTDDDNDVTSQMSDEELQSADDLEAEKHWKKHVLNNRSVIFDSFQGQFKNTVVCSACNFKSVTYEPFMYLSVPLPHAIEKQLCVTFVSASDSPPVQYLITLTKQDEVSKIKYHLGKMITDKLEHPLVIGEVLDCHIAKILDDNYQVRYLDDVNRSIYAFEQLFVMPEDKNDSNQCDDRLSSGDKEAVNSVSDSCAICLEEKESDVIKRHKDCACILCDGCIQDYTQHSVGQTPKCPVCRNDIIPEKDLVSIEQTDIKSSLRLLNVPLVYRVDKTGDGNNNQKTVKLFGHPALLKLPNQIDAEELYQTVSKLHPYKESFKLLLVDGQGLHCSRCMYNQPCKGCVIPRDSHVSLRSDDTLAVTFNDDIKEIREIQHSSMALQRTHKTLSLYDCVQAFSQSEILDEFNPWYCPRCEKNQCATKTLSVWRFPNYLIVYLKRFVFHECTSIKLEDKVMFPLHGFNFNKKNESSYDLYACVCHTGGVSVGHYIAYTQHPLTSEWHCFNDENVSKQKPQEEEYCNAYILFYKKRDMNESNENE